MSSFDYLANQADGREATGRIEAANSDEARRLLAARGLTVRQLTLVAESSAVGASRPLSAAESDQFAGHLAHLGATSLPLEAGLRAAAAETSHQRVAAALNQLADQLGQGVSLETAIAQAEIRLPKHIGGLIAASARTGRLGAALSELLDHLRAARSLRQEVCGGFAYPLFVMGFAAIVIFSILYGISGVFQQMFDDFGLKLPLATRLVFWWRDVGLWVLLASVFGGLVLAWVARQVIGPAAWMRLMATMPIVGRLSYWSGLAEWTGLMSVLIRHDIALPEALRLSAAGVRNAYVRAIAGSLAEATAKGQPFSDALTENRHVPASLVPVIRWGERAGSLSDALATSRELLERRVRMRALVFRAAAPPILFIAIGCQVGALVMALFLPLVSLIRGLT